MPVIYKAHKNYIEWSFSQENSANNQIPNEENSNPFAGTANEEKTPSVSSLTEEYLHHSDIHNHPWRLIAKHHRDYIVSSYPVFHGELLSPPPES